MSNISMRAVPLTVTTRGIGFATAMFYDSLMIYGRDVELSHVCSIHQIYRVGLWLLHYKLYKTQRDQHEFKSDDDVLQHFIIPMDYHYILDGNILVPRVFSMILNAVGKIKTKHSVYHLGYALAPTNPVDLLKYRTLVITPKNIRETLNFLANPNTPIEDIEEFRKFNSIPDLKFDENGRLSNADDIYPADYSSNLLSEDFLAFRILMKRMQTPNSCVMHSWSDQTATKAGLWSSARINIRLDGRKIKGEKESVYFWAREHTSNVDKSLGIGSMVGEECFVHSRSQLSSGYITRDSPTIIMRNHFFGHTC